MENLSFITFVRFLFQSTLILTCTSYISVEGACDKYGDVVIGVDIDPSVLNGYTYLNRKDRYLQVPSFLRRQGVPFIVNLINGLNETRFRTAVFQWVKKDRINEFRAFPLSTNLTKQEKVAAIRRIIKSDQEDYSNAMITLKEFSDTIESAVEVFNDPDLAPRTVTRILVSVSNGNWFGRGVGDKMDILKDNQIISLTVAIETYTNEGINYNNLLAVAQGIKSHTYNYASYAQAIKDIEELPCDPNSPVVSAKAPENEAKSPVDKAAEPE